MKTIEELAQIIRDNPGAVVTVDNDCWWMRPAPPKPIDEMTIAEYDEWEDSTIVSDNDVAPFSLGYIDSNCYGGAILMALAKIVGIELESV